jgi:hypothetical protein
MHVILINYSLLFHCSQKNDRTLEKGHAAKWEAAIKKLKPGYDSTLSLSTPVSKHRSKIMKQEDLDNWVLVNKILNRPKFIFYFNYCSYLYVLQQNLIIVDVLPISNVEKPGFMQLVSNLAPNLILRGSTFFTKKLGKEFKERRQQLIDSLSKCTETTSTIDAWTSRRRLYSGETIYSTGLMPCKSREIVLVLEFAASKG